MSYKETGFASLVHDKDGVQGLLRCPHCDKWVRIDTNKNKGERRMSITNDKYKLTCDCGRVYDLRETIDFLIEERVNQIIKKLKGGKKHGRRSNRKTD